MIIDNEERERRKGKVDELVDMKKPDVEWGKKKRYVILGMEIL